MFHTIITVRQRTGFFSVVAVAMLLLMVSFSQPLASDLPAFQTLNSRFVCAATPISPLPGRATSDHLPPGSPVQLLDVTFGPDSRLYFAVNYATGTGLERENGFVPVEAVSNFCGFSERAAGGQRFVAPPNSCHLIAHTAPNLAALNSAAEAFSAYRLSMAAYRTDNGQYALSLGLLNSKASPSILARAAQLPPESHCATGSSFVAALVKTETAFSPAEISGVSSEAERLVAARALLQTAAPQQDAASLKKACDLGLSVACSLYAQAIYDAPDPAGQLPATVTHYALLGCMGGDVLGCKLAINRSENTLENAQFRAVDGGTGNPADLVTPELAKPGCDAGDAVSCILLARGTARDTTPTLVEAAANFAAYYTACQAGIAWVCRDLLDSFDPVIRARGQAASASADENYALAALLEKICAPGPAQPNIPTCKPAYYKYRDFLQATQPDTPADPRLTTAKALLDRGCAAGDPSACIAQTRLARHWSEEDRNNSAARATALCKAQTEKDTACSSLGTALDPTLPDAAPAKDEAYQALSVTCRTDPSASGPQACAAAVAVATALPEDNRLQLEAMLDSACSNDMINGCQALAELLLHGSSRNPQHTTDQDARAFAALETGCRFDNAPASTCLALARRLADTAQIPAAMAVLAKNCAAQMSAQTGRPETVSPCYEAAKFALHHKTHYPEALAWSDFACKAADAGLSPYACKLMGNIYARGLGTDVNPQQAAIAYQTGCFHPFVKTTDGEACFHYASLLLNAYTSTDQATKATIVLSGDAYDPDQSAQSLITEAARAYDMGCMDDLEQACQLNQKLLADWSLGRYPHDRIHCSVKDDSGRTRSEKICRRFSFYQAAPERKQSRRQLRLDIHVWPDGDKTVIYQDDGRWLLNEVTTSAPQQTADTTCWRNPISKRSFCSRPL
jgi:TPR repeat protein